MSHGLRPSPPDLATEDPRLRILEIHVLGRLTQVPVTALVRRMRFVRAAAAASMTAGIYSHELHG